MKRLRNNRIVSVTITPEVSRRDNNKDSYFKATSKSIPQIWLNEGQTIKR